MQGSSETLDPPAGAPPGAGAEGTLDLPIGFSDQHGLILRHGAAGRLGVVLRAGADPRAVFEVQRFFARPFAFECVAPAAFERLRDPGGGDAPDEPVPGSAVADANAEGLLAGMVREAIRRRATDVHLAPCGEGLAVRLRIGGSLVEVLHVGPADSAALQGRIRALAGLDAPGRAPQQGTIGTFPDCGAIRVATLPVWDGERMLLSLPAAAPQGEALARLGMAPALVRAVGATLSRRSGVVVVAGMAGAGRLDTLHALLAHFDPQTQDVLTVEGGEDLPPPPGVGRVLADPVRPGSIADGLRAAAALGPDVIAVTRLADRETALAAMEAAQGGALVLARMEAPDTVSAVLQLRALGVPNVQIASVLALVLAQRRVRRLCGICRERVQADGSVSALLGFDSGAVVYAPQGCAACMGTGYSGEVGVFEALHVDAAIRRLVNDGGDGAILARHAFLNAPNMGSAARTMAREGLTTPDEAVRISRG